MPDVKPILPNEVYRALPLKLAIDLQQYCKAHKENPADVLADALTAFFDDLGGEIFDPSLIDFAEPAAAGAPA